MQVGNSQAEDTETVAYYENEMLPDIDLDIIDS